MKTKLLGVEVPVYELHNKKYVAMKDLIGLLGNNQGINALLREKTWDVRVITKKAKNGKLSAELYLSLKQIPLFLINVPISSVGEERRAELQRFRHHCTNILHSAHTELFAPL